MKKWIGTISSAVAGILSLVFLSIPAFVVKNSILNETDNTSGWKLLTDKDIADAGYTAVTWYRIFAWILVVLAVVLIVMAVLQLLSNLNVIKMPAILSTINTVALLVLVVVSILALIANFGVRAEVIDDFGGKEVLDSLRMSISVGASLWVVSIINLIAGVCVGVFAGSKKK